MSNHKMAQGSGNMISITVLNQAFSSRATVCGQQAEHLGQALRIS
jgi:hypothetical protein